MPDSPRAELAARLETLDLESRSCRNRARTILVAAVLRDEVDWREAKALGEIIRDAAADADPGQRGDGADILRGLLMASRQAREIPRVVDVEPFGIVEQLPQEGQRRTG
jgi:hypothetical protein